jgi:hypothetical protein
LDGYVYEISGASLQKYLGIKGTMTDSDGKVSSVLNGLNWNSTRRPPAIRVEVQVPTP